MINCIFKIYEKYHKVLSNNINLVFLTIYFYFAQINSKMQ